MKNFSLTSQSAILMVLNKVVGPLYQGPKIKVFKGLAVPIEPKVPPIKLDSKTFEFLLLPNNFLSTSPALLYQRGTLSLRSSPQADLLL